MASPATTTDNPDNDKLASRFSSRILQNTSLPRLTPPARDAILQAFYEAVERRVGARLGDQLSEAEQSEFGALIDAHDDNAQVAFLERKIPFHRDVVREETTRILTVIDLVANALADDPVTLPPLTSSENQ